MKEKSIKDWLQELPDGYRELALANYEAIVDPNLELCESLHVALAQAFVWSQTDQGHRYWEVVWSEHGGDLDQLLHKAFHYAKRAAEIRERNRLRFANSLPDHLQDPTNEAEANLQILDQRDRAIELLREVYAENFDPAGEHTITHELYDKIETFLNQIKP